MGSEFSNWATVGAFIVAVLSMVVAGIMRVAGVERAIDSKVHEAKVELLEKSDDDARMVGEIGAALRQKVTEVELWARDTFVRRDEFKASVDQVNRNIDSLRSSTEVAMKAFDAKMDKLRETIDSKLDKLLSRGS